MPVSLSSSQKAMDQTEYTSSFWKPKAGPEFVDNFVRVLPPHASMEDNIMLPVSLHWPPDGQSWSAFLCPKEMNGETCPVHEAGFAELRKLKLKMDDESARNAVRHHWSSWGYYFLVVLLNKDGTVADEQVKVLSANKELAGLLLDTLKDTDGCPGCEDEDDDTHIPSCFEREDGQGRYVDYSDLEAGFMINIRTKATQVSFGDRPGVTHDYAIKKNRKPTAFDHPELIASAPDPKALNTILTTEEIQDLLSPDGVLLLEAPREGGGDDPLATEEAPADEPVKEDDGWDERPAAEPEPGEESGEDTQAEASGPDPSIPAEAPADEPKKKAPAKKKAAPKAKKADAEDPEKKRQELREKLEQDSSSD